MTDIAVRQPAPALRPFIREYAGFQSSQGPVGTHTGLPSSEVDLIISLGKPIDVLRMPNTTQRPASFQAFVSGLQEMPALVGGGEAFGIHVFIKPLAVRALLGVPNREITSLVVSLEDLLGTRARNLLERLVAAKTWNERLALLDRAFLEKLGSSDTNPEITWAWERLANTQGCMPIHELADKIGWSRRHFTCTFRDVLGITPKTAARIFRFERACRMIRDKRPTLADVAASCGYFDQAHMTHEWNVLAGCTPSAWIASELPFLQDYEMGGCDDGHYENRNHRTIRTDF
jgi:AraC-like DNA-binding protein